MDIRIKYFFLILFIFSSAFAQKKRNKKNVKNSDLWKLLEEKIQDHEIHWMWVKGHNENIFNEKADILAKKAIKS